MRRSLQARLILFLLPPLVLVMSVSVMIQYFFSLRPAMRAFDEDLVDTAIALKEQLHLKDGHAIFRLSPESEQLLRSDQEDAIQYAILGADGALIAGDALLATAPPPVVPDPTVLYDSRFGSKPVRVAALAAPCGNSACQVRIAETLNKRYLLTRDILLGTVLPQLILGAFVCALIWFGVSRALQPLTQLTAQIRQRSPEELRQLDSRDTPREALPLVEALNALLLRLEEAIRGQKRFIADAAHQLRTPLAGVKAEAELALLEAHPPEMHNKLTRIHDSAARASRLANQLLALARTENEASTHGAATPADLSELARDLVDDWVRNAGKKRIDLGFELSPAVTSVQPVMTRELMGNLVHNALEYTPSGGIITVRTGQCGQRAFFEVEDNGPGIPSPLRERVFDRFYRAPGTNGTGSGLGLAIVKEIAVAHAARIEVSEGQDDRGCRIRVQFGAPAAGLPAHPRTA